MCPYFGDPPHHFRDLLKGCKFYPACQYLWRHCILQVLSTVEHGGGSAFTALSVQNCNGAFCVNATAEHDCGDILASVVINRNSMDQNHWADSGSYIYYNQHYAHDWSG